MVVVTHTAPGPSPLREIRDHCQAIVWASVLSHVSILCTDDLMLWFGCPCPFKIRMLKKKNPNAPEDCQRWHIICAPHKGAQLRGGIAVHILLSWRKRPSAVLSSLRLPEGTSFLVSPKPWHSLAAPQCLRLSTQPRFTGPTPLGFLLAPLPSTCWSSCWSGCP